ncbi:T/G mismatch-specific endonuclease [Candidatus Electrothrix marina]|uniref:T/G mismatch-specific endonuclease n=1 Tax=Candidatus Electrothrix marina TaxID=1859130 RepID=A0A444JHA0_9BACT|nr:T/G mismatch-specific endonuclease [Candidatus Electrothrix marina]
MTDHLTPEQRSWNMSRVRSRHTKPELVIRSLLHRAGFRFRIKNNKLPGSPDIVLPKYKTALFVHGCYWHRHEGCSKATMPKSNKEFWRKKFDGNVTRDRRVQEELKQLQWRVMVLWECEIMKDPLAVLDTVIRPLKQNSCREYSLDLDRKEILKVAEKKNRYYLNSSK